MGLLRRLWTVILGWFGIGVASLEDPEALLEAAQRLQQLAGGSHADVGADQRDLQVVEQRIVDHAAREQADDVHPRARQAVLQSRHPASHVQPLL